jgi:CubicO group peptidase (beta-lactamase class C family)
MFINAYDMGRFGSLTQRKGNGNGKQIISEDRIRKATSPTPANTGYGFMNYFLRMDLNYIHLHLQAPMRTLGMERMRFMWIRKNELVAVVRSGSMT